MYEAATFLHTKRHSNAQMYMYVCVCVCLCSFLSRIVTHSIAIEEKKKEKKRRKEIEYIFVTKVANK